MDNQTPPIGPPAGDDRGPNTPLRSYRAWPRSRRRAMAGAAVVVLCGLIALPVIALTSSGGSNRPRSALVFTGPATTEPATTTTEAPSTVPVTTTVAPVPKPAATTTTLVCRNSYNAACGPFRWDAAPASAGGPTVSIQYSPAQPVVGETVTFKVTISDPATAVYICGHVNFGDGMGQNCEAMSTSCQTRYGPWDPPAKHADSATTGYTYKYTQPGPVTFSVQYPVGNPCYDPYRSQASGQVSFTVEAAPTSTTAAP